jgi:hypothetical protein
MHTMVHPSPLPTIVHTPHVHTLFHTLPDGHTASSQVQSHIAESLDQMAFVEALHPGERDVDIFAYPRATPSNRKLATAPWQLWRAQRLVLMSCVRVVG